MAVYNSGLGAGLSTAFDAYNKEKSRQRAEAREKREDEFREDTIETEMLKNKGIRRRHGGLLAAQMEQDRLSRESSTAQRSTLGIRTKATSEKAKTSVASSRAERELIPSRVETQKKTDEASRAKSQRVLDTVKAQTAADIAKAGASIHVSRATAERAKLEKLVSEETIASGVPSLSAEMQFSKAMRGFLGEVYQTALADGPRAADLINDFDWNNDGQPDIVGATDIVIDEAADEIRVLGGDGEPVIDGSTGEPAIYNIEQFKKALEGKDKSKTGGRGGSTKKPVDDFQKRYDRLEKTVRAEYELHEDDIVTGEAAHDLDMRASIIDYATNTFGMKVNQAIGKFGSKRKIMQYTGITEGELQEAVRLANEQVGEEQYNQWDLLRMLAEKQISEKQTKAQNQGKK